MVESGTRPVVPVQPVVPETVIQEPVTTTTTTTKGVPVAPEPHVLKCKVGAHVPCCPDGKCNTRCAGDQCCPGRPLGIQGSFTCPSASKPNAHCTLPKIIDC